MGWETVQSGASGCEKYIAKCFLKVPPACFISTAAAVQPNRSFTEPFSQPDAPDCTWLKRPSANGQRGGVMFHEWTDIYTIHVTKRLKQGQTWQPLSWHWLCRNREVACGIWLRITIGLVSNHRLRTSRFSRVIDHYVQSGRGGWTPGNGKKLSSQAQLGLATCLDVA